MTNYAKGIAAGLIATVVLTIMMMMKATMGLVPQLDPIAMLNEMMPVSWPGAGWVAHFVIGSIVWGVLFTWLSPVVPGPFWLRGVIFGIGAWVVMMVMVMPMAGAGVFGLKLGIMAPAMTLVMHVVYGAVLGGTYGMLVDQASLRRVT